MTPAAPAFADLFRLDGKTALVTGGSSGLGVAIAIGMAQMGATVAVAGRRAARLHETVDTIEQLGARAFAVPCDITDPDACTRAVAETVGTYKSLDILVNNAGAGAARPATRETPHEFEQVVSTNLHGTYWMSQAAARAMEPGSSIINLASVLAFTTAGLPQAAYASSKSAIVGLTRDLAQQWSGRKGIRVNAIAPGFFETEMTEEYEDSYVDTVLRPRIVLGRPGRPNEIAAAAVWLASPAAGYVTGQTIVVDGGFTLS